VSHALNETATSGSTPDDILILTWWAKGRAAQSRSLEKKNHQLDVLINLLLPGPRSHLRINLILTMDKTFACAGKPMTLI
jgi:hypothetical protein